MSLKPGDTYTATRDAKVFLTQYTALSAHVSLTRVLGDDPEADRAEMEVQVDRMWHEAMLANHKLANGAYDALGEADGNVDKLIEYLERNARGESQETPAVKAPLRKRKLGTKPG